MTDRDTLGVVLVDPEIPPNTGNVARTCVATGVPLYLVGRLGFSLKDRYLRRAGLDYLPHLRLSYERDLASLRAAYPSRRFVLTSARGHTSHTSFRFRSDDLLVFGREADGLPAELLASSRDTVFVPTPGPVRSLNLSSAVAVVLYEALRQLEERGR
jgi:tRNA (cytidine/uridine-2'-O-)-methyltransferase